VEPKDSKKKQIWKEIGLNRWTEIKIDPTLDVLPEIERWKALPNVETVEPIYQDCLILFPNEYNFYQKWEHYNTGDNFADIGEWSFNSTEDADIDTVEAWDITTGNGIIIGNPDQSIMWYHKDLVNNIIRNLGEDFDGDGEVIIYNGTTTEGSSYGHSYPHYYFDPDDVNGIDDDGNGYIDDFIGWDLYYNDNDPSDTRNHGTQTSGVIAAEANNSYSVMGVCWNCTVIPTASTSHQPEGIIYGVNLGARAVTLSWYLSGPSQSMIDAVEYATQNNASVILGAGNWENPYVNPSCKIKEVICVTGTNWYDRLWTYPPWNEGTDYGPKSDVGAPASLHTTTGAFASSAYPHQFSQGTSLAAPTVAGVIGLMLSINPDLDPYEVKSIVQTAVDPFVQQDRYAGNGRINAHTAVLLANQSLQYGSFPVTIIDANATSYSNTTITILGIVKSPEFLKSEIYVGEGIYPSSFELISQINDSVEDGLIYSLNLSDISNLNAGDWQLKIITYDLHNQTSQDTFPFVIYEPGVCGNNVLEPPFEECDDNNTVSGDGCSDLCITEYCGDNITNNVDEKCDDGNDINTDACLDSCIGAKCGDSYLWDGVEECDDSNAVSGDGCSDICIIEFCGDSIINNVSEECEGDSLGGNDCIAQGFTNGTLGCTNSCGYNESNCYNITTINLVEGWNLVSIPHNLTNNSIGALESDIILSYFGGNWLVYYQGIQEEITEIEIARGYLVYSIENKTLYFDEGPIITYEPTLAADSWNLVGSTTSGNSFSDSYIYDYQGSSISGVDTIIGTAYWVYTGSNEPQFSDSNITSP